MMPQLTIMVKNMIDETAIAILLVFEVGFFSALFKY